ncbi:MULTISPECIES: PP2C family protein-serine/threonine phosphatase [Rufibacter]|uniref:Sigma-B regulation protein RsbU (Phosphoserine phosphatase) n=1 Tax=Rufibacter quisquiliarum TaxID=1549639 RepID=A0A839GH51_9BACT|nr:MULTISPECIES: PP2C family protein-serine/threonine phosphatase [Rufibacter]MBA9077900.1 sigma-B regulation protein RsbU (phosphoserine phosphatase) [Rufibacter quisquiliarum]
MSELKFPTVEQELNLKKLELAALLEITKAINNNLPEEALYKIYHFTLLAQLNIRRLSLFLLDEQWECKVCFGTDYNFRELALPQEIAELREITSLSKLNIDRRWHDFETVIPIIHNSRILAFVMIGNVHAYYTTLGALSFVQTLSNIILVAMENRRLERQRLAQEAVRKEVEIAREVQNMLFPKSLPNNQQVSVHATYIPHSSIGGDYYDYIPIDKDQFLFCVADVSGKGVPASLLMSNFQAGLRTILRQTTNLDTIVSELNDLIYRNAVAEKFITCFLGIYNRTTRELSYVNAGHNASILLYENNTYQLLEEGCTMLGIFDVLPFLKVTKVPVPPQSFVFCYTDGLTEVFNQEEDEFGVENTIKFLQCCRFVSSRNIHTQLLQEINAYNSGNSFHDDITLLSCRFK